MARGTLVRLPAPEPPLPSPLRQLPLTRWASRFESGHVSVAGHLDAPFSIPELEVPSGPVAIEMSFLGGPPPTIPAVTLRTPSGERSVQGLQTPIKAVESMVDVMRDLSVRIRALPGADLWVRVMPGVSALIPGDAEVVFEAETTGPSGRPRLARPVAVSIGGAGLSIRLPGAAWLRILASVAIRRAELAPDGAVELHGHERSRLDRAVGFGLRRASHHLSDLVRRHPHFERVRTFLDDRDG